MIPSVSTHPSGRKPSLWPLPPRDWKATRPSPAGEHYLRPYVAERVREATARGRVHGLLQAHLRAAKARLPKGRAGASLLGRATAILVLDALINELAARHPRRIEGGAVAFCSALGVTVAVDAASAALRLILARTPILRREGRYRWSVDLATLKTSRLGDLQLDAVLFWPSKTAEEQRPGVAPATASASDDSEQIRTGIREHAPAVVLVHHPAAEGQQLELEITGGLGCASPSPAEQAGAGLDNQAASVGDAPVRPTLSGFLQNLPRHKRQAQAVELIQQAGPATRGYQTAREAAKDLLNLRVGRTGQRPYGREIEAVARALDVLRRRGDLSAGYLLPQFALQPWLVLLGIRQRPSRDRPTAGQIRYMRGRGIDPTGLSRQEAQALQSMIQLRANEAKLWPRQIQRFMEAHGWAGRFASACASGQIGEGLELSVQHLRGLYMSGPVPS